MVHLENLSKIYRTPQGEVKSLDRLNLDVQPGEFIVIRGASGCGKTTLLLTVGGMLFPTSGQVRVGDQDLYALSSEQRARFRASKVGFVFQMFHLVPFLSVEENILLAAGAGSGRPDRSRAKELIDQLGLTSRIRHKPAALSTGERQRTAIARALLNRPQLILADEPTGNLDPENTEAVFQHLQGFQRSGGTVIVVTHGTAADACASRIIEMRAGAVNTPRVTP